MRINIPKIFTLNFSYKVREACDHRHTELSPMFTGQAVTAICYHTEISYVHYFFPIFNMRLCYNACSLYESRLNIRSADM